MRLRLSSASESAFFNAERSSSSAAACSSCFNTSGKRSTEVKVTSSAKAGKAAFSAVAAATYDAASCMSGTSAAGRSRLSLHDTNTSA